MATPQYYINGVYQPGLDPRPFIELTPEEQALRSGTPATPAPPTAPIPPPTPGADTPTGDTGLEFLRYESPYEREARAQLEGQPTRALTPLKNKK